MKKILYLSWTLPNDKIGTAGGKAHNYYLKSIEKDPRFEVIEVALSSKKQREDCDLNYYNIKYYTVKRLEKVAGRILTLCTKWNPFNKYGNLMNIYYVSEFKKILIGLSREGFNPDVIITEWFQMTSMIEKIKVIFPSAKCICVERDVAYLGVKRKWDASSGIKKFFLGRSYHSLKKRELYCCSLCDVIGVNNYKDYALLIDGNIDPTKLYLVSPYYMKLPAIRYDNMSKRIIFYGAMNRMENYMSTIWFIENVMNHLPEEYKFVVMGANPNECLLKYSSDRIIITGFVENVSEVFSDCYCVVAPLLYGAGIKIKILEAMSLGLPVVCNDVAIEGIPAQDGKHYIHCNSKEEYIKALINPDLIHSIAGNGIEFIKKTFDYEYRLEEYLQLIDSL